MALQIRDTGNLTKEDKYISAVGDIKLLIEGEPDLIANLANVSSLLKNTFEEFLWAGFYIVRNDDPEELVLGPFQGRPACTRIRFGNGVCGTSAKEKKTIIVEDVDKFPGHIVCDSLSKSEIVVPIIAEDKVVAVIDIDSGAISNFDLTDKKYLEEISSVLSSLFRK